MFDTDIPDAPDARDELDRAAVRRRLAELRRRGMLDRLNEVTQQPLAPGSDGHDVTQIIDAFGRGPSSPFHMPDVRPSWAPDWQPRPFHAAEGPDDDGIIWKVE